MIAFVCANCSTPFEREKRQVSAKQRTGQGEFFCGRSCATSYYRRAGVCGNVTREPEHGTRYRYMHFGCRCDPCRAAQATYQREYRQRHR
jgi:hypothetical protein